MILLEDTRQQEGKHRNIEAYCKRKGIDIVRMKLDCCDYMLSEDGQKPSGSIGVDTKKDLMEICKDIMSKDHRRFRQQCERAKEAGVQLIILIEELPPYGDVSLWDVPRWKSSNEWHRFGDRMTQVEPRSLKKAMKTMEVKYGVKFRFCTRRQSPQRVIKYLKGEYR